MTMDTTLMPEATALGIEIHEGERNFLARHVNRVLHEERRRLAGHPPHDEDPPDWKEIVDSFKRIAVMVSFTADIGWEPVATVFGGRFDLHSVLAPQAAVWVRRFIEADRSMVAFGAGRLVDEIDSLTPVSSVARALQNEIELGVGLLQKLESE